MVKLKAVVDSSFWINLNKTDLVKYLFDYFDLYFTEKVEDGLYDYKDTRASVPKDLDSFIQLKKLDFVQVKNPKTVSKKLFDTLSNYSGEIYTIALAEELNAIVLTDDSGPLKYCNRYGIISITTPTFILKLFKDRIITKEIAKQKINLIKKSIRKEIIGEALKQLK
jgi:predicted nucleic acid-binding protein